MTRRRRTAPSPAPAPPAAPAPPVPAGWITYREAAITAAIVFAVWVFANASTRQPTPAERRPAVAWVVRTAKSLLWIAAFAERPPEEPVAVRHDLGVDGFPLVDHGRGW